MTYADCVKQWTKLKNVSKQYKIPIVVSTQTKPVISPLDQFDISFQSNIQKCDEIISIDYLNKIR